MGQGYRYYKKWIGKYAKFWMWPEKANVLCYVEKCQLIKPMFGGKTYHYIIRYKGKIYQRECCRSRPLEATPEEIEAYKIENL